VKYNMEVEGRTRQVEVVRDAEGTGWRVAVDGQEGTADAQWTERDVLSLLIAGRSYRVLYDPRSDGAAVALGARRIAYTVADPRSLRSREQAGASHAGACTVKAPMPGRIVRVLVHTGDSVEAQQGLLVMEAMKMQNELKSPSRGTVTRIAVGPGATIQPGQVLVVIE